MVEEKIQTNNDSTEEREIEKSQKKGGIAEPSEEVSTLSTEEQESAESFSDPEIANLLDRSFANVEEGRIVRGRIVQIHDSDALIDIGYKSEGTIPIKEFKTPNGDQAEVNVGDIVDVFLEDTEDENGLVVLSKEKADRIQVWEDITRSYEEGKIIEGKVCERIKGGLSVDIGVKAFLPGSQVDLRPIRNLESLIGETIKTKIIKLNRRRGNIVLSRRAILEAERESARQDTLDSLEEGKIVTGIVKNITDYGIFIDLGGVDGLLHITDISWGRVNHPSELFQLGDEIEVVVLSYDKGEEKVSLGLKQKTPDPWESVEEKYPIGSRVKGTVVSITDYGAFVELETGVEGLVHISEMSWTKRVKHPSKVVELDDTVEAIVLDLDRENRRISLGLKQIEPNPWAVVAEKYPPGSIVTGIVRNLTDFGAFIELEEGVDGLVHISDMSWTTRIKHPSEVLKKGEQVQAVLLSIDVESERLSLGIKQLHPNPWEGIADSISVGDNVTGKVVRLTDFGAFIELANGVEGLLHVSEISRQHIKKPEDVLSVDSEITAKVIKLDEENRRIGLSIKAYEEEIEETASEEETTAAEGETAESETPEVKAEAPEAEAAGVPEVEAEAAPEVETEAEAPEVEAEKAPEVEAETPEVEVEAAPEAETEVEAPEVETEISSEADTELEMETETSGTAPEVEPEAETEVPESEAEVEAEPETVVESPAEPETEAKVEPEVEPQEPELQADDIAQTSVEEQPEISSEEISGEAPSEESEEEPEVKKKTDDKE